MKKLILKIYNHKCARYMKLWKKAMRGMEKHMFDIHNTKLMKYAKQSYNYRIKFENIIEKRDKLLKTWR